MEKLVTIKTVQDAIKTLEDRGDRVSQRNIRQLLGGGSPNLINKYFREIQAADESGTEILTEIPEKLAATIVNEINTLTRAATEKLTGELGAAQQETSDTVADLEEAQKRIEDLAKEMEALKAEHQTAVNNFEKTTERLKVERERADQATEKAEKQLENERQGKIKAEQKAAVADQRIRDLEDMKAEKNGIIAEQKKEIQELRKEVAGLNKQIAELLKQ